LELIKSNQRKISLDVLIIQRISITCVYGSYSMLVVSWEIHLHETSTIKRFMVSELVTAFSGKCWKCTTRMKWLKLSPLSYQRCSVRVLIGQHVRFKLEITNDINAVD